MATELETKLLNVITEQLPQAHVGVLREYLQKAQHNEEELIKANERLIKLKAERDDLNQKNIALAIDLRKLQGQKETIEVKEKELVGRELKLDKAILEIKLASMTSERDNLKQLSETVFRNPMYTSRHYNNEHVSGHNAPGGWVSDHNKSVTNTLESTIT